MITYKAVPVFRKPKRLVRVALKADYGSYMAGQEFDLEQDDAKAGIDAGLCVLISDDAEAFARKSSPCEAACEKLGGVGGKNFDVTYPGKAAKK